MSKAVEQSISSKDKNAGRLTYFLKAAVGLASIPAFWISAISVSAQSLPSLPQPSEEGAVDTAPPAVFPAIQRNGVLPSIERQNIPLSPGDLLNLKIPGIGGEEFTGEYVVNFSGNLEIPLIEPLPVLGLSPMQVQDRLTEVLIRKGYFRPGLVNASVQVLDYSPIQIAVAGEVFEPGRVLLSNTNVDKEGARTVVAPENNTGNTPGDYPLERYLTSALKAIGGVKPTADVTRVQVIRGTESTVVDLSGIFLGAMVTDFPLVSGDQIIIPDSGTFQQILVQPSQITPDSVELYVSNVTEGSSNNLDRNRGINSASFKYGTNLAQALVAAQCVGGTPSTNANRRAVLIQTDSLTGSLKTSEYRVNDLVSNETKTAAENPFLMPEDAIACYDSRNINIRGILGTVTDFINPLNLLFNLFGNN
ncbi:MAG: polysaccharide export protein [Leptolyngbya foveolarum]|uniref:Polysaccharide export protein n=1 Tax=Leptolyngbya foveolarum TaxID=47253 RepID=A0A2W4VET4_9CYAN|nr:MAG: polysaccharide export protein [Leptolyngbya foveolarum]